MSGEDVWSHYHRFLNEKFIQTIEFIMEITDLKRLDELIGLLVSKLFRIVHYPLLKYFEFMMKERTSQFTITIKDYFRW